MSINSSLNVALDITNTDNKPYGIHPKTTIYNKQYFGEPLSPTIGVICNTENGRDDFAGKRIHFFLFHDKSTTTIARSIHKIGNTVINQTVQYGLAFNSYDAIQQSLTEVQKQIVDFKEDFFHVLCKIEDDFYRTPSFKLYNKESIDIHK